MLKLNKKDRLKIACYLGNITMASISCLSPLLFTTFNSEYGISFTLLGFLILVSFAVQLIIDLIFSFFADKFNIPLTVKVMPLIAILGFFIYASSPWLFKGYEYFGLVLGTIIFSASAGLGEVLISPIIAEIYPENADAEMGKLHSVFAWGCVGNILIGTLLLMLFSTKNWQILVFMFALTPLICAILFMSADIPDFKTDSDKTVSIGEHIKNKELWICFVCIFIGGATECTMSQWASSYLELSLGIDKVLGDIFGFALFSVALGIGRVRYAKNPINIEKNILIGIIGSAICYLLTALSPLPFLGLLGCAFTGYFVAMLWPGSLIISSERIVGGGVFIYAMMAAGGDLGASLGPQLVGIVTDIVSNNDIATSIATSLSITPDALAMKCAILIGSIFPIIGIFICTHLFKTKSKRN